jgi:hypothetical protein
MTALSSLAAASQIPVASLQARLVIALVFVVLGVVLAFDVKDAASRLHRANSGFTPWGKKLADRFGSSPVRIIGAFFLIGGIAALISVAVNP